MRRILTYSIFVCLSLIVLGGLAVKTGYLNSDSYIVSASISGTVALFSGCSDWRAAYRKSFGACAELFTAAVRRSDADAAR